MRITTATIHTRTTTRHQRSHLKDQPDDGESSSGQEGGPCNQSHAKVLHRASQPGTSTAQSKTERLQEDTALIENKVAKAWLIMAKRASMEQDLRLRTAAMHYRLAEKKYQDKGIDPEPYEPPQTDEKAARDQQVLDDIFDTC